MAEGRRNRRVRLNWILICGILAFIATGLLLTNCTSLLARAMVKAPNQGRDPDRLGATDPEVLENLGIDHEVRVRVGPPTAELSLWILLPGDQASKTPEGNHPAVLLLHGIRDRKDSMAGLGLRFASQGYTAVLVDLRGHGRSSGDWMTYGVVEARDLSQVIDWLIGENLSNERIGILGASYGGATAIQLAGIDKRVRAVVAIAPFASMKEVVPLYVRRFLPAWLVSEGRIQDALAEAGHLAGFDPEAASPRDAMAAIEALVLLIHGREDRKIPYAHSRALHEAGRERSKLILLDGEGHDSIMADYSGTIARESSKWFADWLSR